jgi:hypothetical protein
MPTPTYTPLSNITLGSTATSVTFGSIPATYRDLILIIEGSPADTSFPAVWLRANSDTGSNYSYVRMTGNGSSAASLSNASQTVLQIGSAFGLGGTTASRANFVVQIMDYSATDKHKSVLSRANTPNNGVEAATSRWANTAAITTIQALVSAGAGFATGTTFSLYGVIA